MRFLHLADVHLDTAFRGRSDDLRSDLREAARRALATGVEEAIRRELDAVLIAGDLFDGERLSVRTERFVGETLARLGQAGIPTIYVTGNHDPGGTGGARDRIPWPEHVHVIDDPTPRRVAVVRRGRPDEVAGYVTGAGHDSPRVTADLSRAFPRPEGEGPHVALLHTQVGGARGEGEHDPYAPSELSRLRSSGYDYWALGHVHARQALAEDPPVHYPGNPQGRHPGESGAKGGLLVELSGDGGADVQFIELGPVRWETLRLDDIADETRLYGVVSRVERAWSEARARDPGGAASRWILRLELGGASPLHGELAKAEVVDELREALIPALGLAEMEVRVRGMRPVVRVEDHLDRNDVLGQALRSARALSEPKGPSPSEALGLGRDDLAAPPEEGGDALDAYLRELLKGSDATLLDALIDPEDA